MNRYKGLALAVVFLSSCVGGCATKMDAIDASRIRTISIAAVKEPNYYFYVRGANEDFNPAMRSQGLHLGSELADAVAKALKNEGYEVSVGDPLSRADAVLEISLGGLLPDQLGPIYTKALGGPVFTAKVRLQDASTRKTLFSQLYEVADPFIKPMDGTVLIIPDRKYADLSVNESGPDPAGAAEGFRSVVPAVGQRIAASLKK